MKVITIARKPVAGSVAQNVIDHGAGAINIGGCRIKTPDGRPHYKYPNGAKGWGFHGGVGGRVSDGSRSGDPVTADAGGRWPSNLILQGEAVVENLGVQSGVLTSGKLNQASVKAQNKVYGKRENNEGRGFYSDPKVYEPDTGTAARFFKQVK